MSRKLVGYEQSGGSVEVMADGSVNITPAAGKNPQINGSDVTASAAELNKVHSLNAPAYLVVAEERTFTETTGAGTYTATVSIPAGATVLDVIWHNTALWTAATSATLDVGDADDSKGYFSDVNVKAAPIADTNGSGAGLSSAASSTGSGSFAGVSGRYCAAAKTITATVVTVGSSGNAGRSRLLVKYVTPTATAATKA